MNLHPYQTAAMEAVASGFRTRRSQLLSLATGAGKTVIAGAIVRRLAAENSECKSIALVLVHRRELVRQTYDTLCEFGLESMLGVIQSGRAETPWAPLQIASVQTLVRRLGKLDWLNPRLVFVDEAHHACAETWRRVLNHYSKSYLLGMTATPARLDGQGLGEFFESIVSGPSIAELVEGGYLCRTECWSLDAGMDTRGLRINRSGDYSQTQMDERATGPVIAAGVANCLRLAPDRRILHFAASVRHSQKFVEKLNEAVGGRDAEHVDGRMPSAARDAVFRRFASGETRVVSNVALVDEGFDVPECDCVAMGAPTASITRYRQQCGRAMRVKSDGRAAMLLDLAGNLHRHGLPDEEIEWTLEDGERGDPRERASNLRVCRECGHGFSHSAEACPQCGWVPPVRMPREVDVELVPIAGSGVAVRRQETPGERRSRLNRAARDSGGDVSVLKSLCREGGYSEDMVKVWQTFYSGRWAKERSLKGGLHGEPLA